MQDKTVFFIIILLTLILIVPSHSYKYGGNCNERAILDGNHLIGDSYSDNKQAYNGIASCGSLRSALYTACCYIKVKYRNKQADKKYTHYGCIEIYDNELVDIKTVINNLKANITHNEVEIDKTKVDIDCHSKLIKLTGLFLLAFLL